MNKIGENSSNPHEIFKIQFELLKSELELSYSAIRQHAEIGKGIKNWAIVAWSGSVGLVLASETLCNTLWLTGIIPLLFWFVDGLYARVMISFLRRVHEISDFVNSENFKNSVQTGSPFSFELLAMRKKTIAHNGESFRGIFRELIVFFYPTVSILYIGLAIVSVVAWTIVAPNNCGSNSISP